MIYTTKPSNIRVVKQGDDNFMIREGMTLYPRAMICIPPECPGNLRAQLQYYINEGWIKPVAYMRDSELVWEQLSHSNEVF